MIIENLNKIFERDLQKLKVEINAFKDEYDIWKIQGDIANSGGNLCLHLVGNLNHFIGATLGNTGYVRHRDDEFSLKNVLRQDLVTNIDNCILIVTETLGKLRDDDLQKDFPLEKHGETVSTLGMLLHLYGHLTYHLGQINYLRRSLV
ncbi:MAG: DUF1572 family protein [Chitinophagaceae bacterium]|nr:DUF1572 family protein [Chitinophagaceae bacterium]